MGGGVWSGASLVLSSAAHAWGTYPVRVYIFVCAARTRGCISSFLPVPILATSDVYFHDLLERVWRRLKGSDSLAAANTSSAPRMTRGREGCLQWHRNPELLKMCCANIGMHISVLCCSIKLLHRCVGAIRWRMGRRCTQMIET